MTLRQYQQEAKDQIIEKYKQGIRKILLVIGCGGGKTNIAASIIEDAAKKGNRSLFAAHRRELITQCQGRLKSFNVDASLILGGHKRDYANVIQIASIQSLLRNELPNAKVVFIDEAHTSTSKGYIDVINKYHATGALIIGLTATPFRTDKKGLGLVYEDYVQPITNSELIEQKAVLPTKVYYHSGITTKNFKKERGEFADADAMRAFDVDNVYLNLINNYQRFADNLQTIVFCQNVKHSIKTRDCFRENGYTAEHIDAETSDEERDRIVNDYRDGKITILCNYGILAEGFDVPSTRCVIMNCATTSRIKWIQACGRCQRPYGDKTCGIVLDMADNGVRFGYPEENITVDLFPEKKEKKEAGVAPMSVCGQCYFLFSAKTVQCPECGWMKPIKSKRQLREEIFSELTKKEVADIKKKEKDVVIQANIELNKSVWEGYTKKDWPKIPKELLTAFAKFKGYSNGWVWNERQKK